MLVLPIDRASSEPVDRVAIRTTLPLRGVRTAESVGQTMTLGTSEASTFLTISTKTNLQCHEDNHPHHATGGVAAQEAKPEQHHRMR